MLNQNFIRPVLKTVHLSIQILADYLVWASADHQLSRHSPVHWHDKGRSFVATEMNWIVFRWATNNAQITSTEH